MTIQTLFQDPPRQYTLVPFWFLNDDLDEDELRRQIDDFAAHGVHGFIPHPRLGLPETIPFLSDAWMHYLKVCVGHAAALGMTVILYDEAMYPSGSAAGQVVAEDERFATRCLDRKPKDATLARGEELVWEDDEHLYVNRRSFGRIRGVHYGADDADADAPPSGDLLNPEAMAAYFRLVHDRHFEALGEHFGDTIIAFFTDEPNVLGRRHQGAVLPWTRGFEHHLERALGRDIRPELGALFDAGHPDHGALRRDFANAVTARLEETFYAPYARWCADHGIALTGHPHAPDDLAVLRHFHIPGQDIVWRAIVPGDASAVAGPASTMAACALSAQVHHGRARNANECFGAYGHEFTEDEMRFVTNWLLVRGANLLMPHAFFYSLRGARRDERPPDVGPNSPWWDRYGAYAAFCRRVCALTGEGRPVCDTLILGRAASLPWRAARILQEHQRGYLYADTRTIAGGSTVTPDGLTINGRLYRAVIVDGPAYTEPAALAMLEPLAAAGRVVAYLDPAGGVPAADSPEALLAFLDAVAPPPVTLNPPCSGVRCLRVAHDDGEALLFANEGETAVESELTLAIEGQAAWWDPRTGRQRDDLPPDRLALGRRELLVLWVAR